MNSDQPPPPNPPLDNTGPIPTPMQQNRDVPPDRNEPLDDLSSTTSDTDLGLNRPCRIKGINFEGAKRTRPYILSKMVTDIFPAQTLWDLLERAVQVRENLRSLNAFSEIEIKVEPIDGTNNTDYILTFVVTEKGRIIASTEAACDSRSVQTHLNLDLTAPNMTGIGDSVQFSTRFKRRFHSGECKYSVPLKPWKQLFNPIYSLAYSQYQYDSQPNGIDQEDKSIINRIDFLSHPMVQHSISFENVWRYIKSSSLATPREIREQSGHSVKSSLRHDLTWDSRVGGKYPFAGVLAGVTNEFTINLVHNSAKFTRHEAHLQLNTLIKPEIDLLCQINMTAGSLIRPQKMNICDRFYLGGPLTLRGFKLHGVGPSCGNYPLGGQSYLSAGIHLYSILPYTKPDSTINQHLRLHAFFNSGTIGDLGEIRNISRNNFKTELVKFRDSFRHSCGFGLVLYLMSLRLEINYCFPLVYRDSDLINHGHQWGIGFRFT